MASSPAGRRNLYANNKDYPGCMGGLIHLFDFNQALAGRKLLTDKKSGTGLEVPRNSSDVGGRIPEVPKPYVERSEEVPYGYEAQRASASRKSNGMPIKALIAQELAKEADSKNRAPSVVARLMGLDALLTDSKALQKPPTGSFLGKLDEKFMQRPTVERQRHEEIAPHSVRLYAKTVKASAISGQITPKSSHSQGTENQARKQYSESPGLRNHPQEQQLQEFKKAFEAWQTQKSWANSKRSSRLDDRQVHMPGQQSLPRERQFDAKPAIFQENFPGENVNITNERLHESREFQDALDFLQSNKEFFMRFLQEPNSLIARHLQDNKAEIPLDVTKGMKHMRSQQSPDTRESPRPTSWARDSPLSRQYENISSREDSRPLSWSQESPISRNSGGSLLIEKGNRSTPHSPMINNEEYLRRHDQISHSFSPVASQSRSLNSDSHVPTRIVVLKPSPGKVRNLKSTTPAYFRSPKDHSACDAFSEDNTDVLERLREKLRKDNSYEYNKSGRKNGVLHLNEQYRDSSKDPREIAREIARQVRENITRDLMVDPRYVHSSARKKSTRRRPTQHGDLQDNTTSDGKPRELTNWVYLDSYTRSSRQPVNDYALEAMRSSIDLKADMIEIVKKRVSDSTSHGHNLRIKNTVLDRRCNGTDSHSQFSAGLHTSSSSKGSGELTVDGPFVSEPHDGTLFHDYGQVENSLKSDLAADLEHNNRVDQIKASFLDSLAVFGPEQAENVPALQVGEVAAEVVSENVFCNEVVDLERPTDALADSMDLATLDVSLATSEAKQTSIVMKDRIETQPEDHDGSQPSEEMAAVSTEWKQHNDGKGSHCSHELPDSLHSNPSRDSQTSIILDDLPKVDSMQASDYRSELLEKSDGEVAYLPKNVQTFERDHISEIDNNDPHVPLDTTPVHAAMASFSTCGSNFIMQPVKEQPEQPSPVSVLDLPFQDESSVSTEFKELSSDLEELRMRLRLLNFDNGNHDLENDGSLESEVDGGLHSEVCHVEDYNFDRLQTDENDFVGNTCIDVADWKGENSEMCYIRDVLAASGFTGDSSSVLTQWYAPGQPLNPRFFQNLEKCFCEKEEGSQELIQAASKSITQEGVLSMSRRHLLFDIANEVLLDILGSYMNQRVWLSSKVAASMPPEKDLVNLVWTHVRCSLCSHSGSQETLENLVTKDLGKGSCWLDIGAEMEAAGLDVERAILDDLIEEILLVL